MTIAAGTQPAVRARLRRAGIYFGLIKDPDPGPAPTSLETAFGILVLMVVGGAIVGVITGGWTGALTFAVAVLALAAAQALSAKRGHGDSKRTSSRRPGP